MRTIRILVKVALVLTMVACREQVPPPPDETTQVSRPPEPVAASYDSAGKAEPAIALPVEPCVATTAADGSRNVNAGARIFEGKRCGRCHTIGAGYRDGPDLVDVTSRQSCEWVVALLTDTENMIQNDPELQQLRIEHFLDMPNPNLSVAEARAVYAYLRAASADSTRVNDARFD